MDKGPSEKVILAQIKQYLRRLQSIRLLAFTRIHVMPVLRGRPGSKKRFFLPNVDMVGFSDIEVVVNGRVGYIEVKTKTGKLSVHQNSFLELRKLHGAKICIARSVEEVRLFLKSEMGLQSI